jgi:hypothetical protein
LRLAGLAPITFAPWIGETTTFWHRPVTICFACMVLAVGV